MAESLPEIIFPSLPRKGTLLFIFHPEDWPLLSNDSTFRRITGKIFFRRRTPRAHLCGFAGYVVIWLFIFHGITESPINGRFCNAVEDSRKKRIPWMKDSRKTIKIFNLGENKICSRFSNREQTNFLIRETLQIAFLRFFSGRDSIFDFLKKPR